MDSSGRSLDRGRKPFPRSRYVVRPGLFRSRADDGRLHGRNALLGTRELVVGYAKKGDFMKKITKNVLLGTVILGSFRVLFSRNRKRPVRFPNSVRPSKRIVPTCGIRPKGRPVRLGSPPNAPRAMRKTRSRTRLKTSGTAPKIRPRKRGTPQSQAPRRPEKLLVRR